MAYIPLNKIITNQYTDGTEYQLASSGVVYVGFYHKKYNGEITTGKTPNSPHKSPLIPINPKVSNALQDGTSFSTLYVDDIPFPLVSEYLDILNLDYSKQTKSLPSPFYPQPTEDDYKLGSFIRYFCVKVNEDNYLEIDSKTFTSLINQDKSWNWELYTPFRIQWTLTGEEEEVKQTNYNITLLQEQRLKRVGLQSFLRKNYLKYYQ
tara:strand:+ start:1998 stop:2618 length:621 start_codon:yes stop_codon:yes gene_type:complete